MNQEKYKKLAKKLKEDLPYLKLKEKEIAEILRTNELIFIPRTYASENDTYFSKEQDLLINLAYSKDINGFSVLEKEDDYKVLAEKDDIIDLGIVIITSEMAMNFFIGLITNGFYDVIKSSIERIFKIRSNIDINKIGTLKYQDSDKHFELKNSEISNKALLSIIKKMDDEKSTNKVNQSGK